MRLMSVRNDTIIDIAVEKYKKIEEALKQGKTVVLRGIYVRKIEMKWSRRTPIFVINDGEISLYPSQLIRTKVVII